MPSLDVPPILSEDISKRVTYNFDFASTDFKVTIVSTGDVFEQNGTAMTKQNAIWNLGLYTYCKKSASIDAVDK